VRARADLAIPLARAAQAPSVAAGRRARRAVGRSASGQGPRLRGGPREPPPPLRARLLPQALRYSGRPLDSETARGDRARPRLAGDVPRALRAAPALGCPRGLRESRHGGGCRTGGSLALPLVPTLERARPGKRRRAAAGARARRALRPRQPGVLLAAARQDLLFLAEPPSFPGLPRRRRLRARQRRSHRRRGRVPRTG